MRLAILLMCGTLLGASLVSATENFAGYGEHWYSFTTPSETRELLIRENHSLTGVAVIGSFRYAPNGTFDGQIDHISGGHIAQTIAIGDGSLDESFSLAPTPTGFTIRWGCATCLLPERWSYVIAVAGEVGPWAMSPRLTPPAASSLHMSDEAHLFSAGDFRGPLVAHTSVNGNVARAVADGALSYAGDDRTIIAYFGSPIVEPLTMTMEGPDGVVESCNCWGLRPGEQAGQHIFRLTDVNVATNDIFVLTAEVTLPD